jgi:hemoglobin
MKAIDTRDDIELLVKEFYSKVRKNPTLGPIFDDVMKIDWDHHIPILIDFWETILLDNPVYRRNAMGVHFGVNEKIKLEKEHFTTWLFLFDSTVDEYFEGEKAVLAKRRAHDIANLMSYKMDEINKS